MQCFLSQFLDILQSLLLIKSLRVACLFGVLPPGDLDRPCAPLSLLCVVDPREPALPPRGVGQTLAHRTCRPARPLPFPTPTHGGALRAIAAGSRVAASDPVKVHTHS
jgi:hypothetical protein